MHLAYAAVESGPHGEEPGIGEAILHEVQNADVLNLWPFGHIALPKIALLGIDLSITRCLVMLWVASVLLVVLFAIAFRRPRLVPNGMANSLEAVVVFLRDEVIVPTMGEAGKCYLPFFGTVFFFILFANLLGLVPYGATATGNVTVTAALALIALVMIQVAGMRAHGLRHHLRIPGGAVWYATTCRECPAGCGLWVRTREGRAVKVEGNPAHPVNAGRLCARGRASL